MLVYVCGGFLLVLEFSVVSVNKYLCMCIFYIYQGDIFICVHVCAVVFVCLSVYATVFLADVHS